MAIEQISYSWYRKETAQLFHKLGQILCKETKSYFTLPFELGKAFDASHNKSYHQRPMPKRRPRKSLPEGEFNADITQLSHEGRGIAHIDGKTTFIFGALPGEQVKFKYTRQRNSYDEGQVTKVLQANPQRAQAKCPHFMVCGGCSLQHLSTDMQINHKQQMVLEQLKHHDVIPQQILPAITASPWQYRRKARMSAKYVAKKEKVMVGFFERQGRLIADIESCAVLHPSIGEHIADFKTMIYALDDADSIRQLEVAVDDHTAAVIVRHIRPLSDNDLQALIECAKQHELQLYLQPKGPDSVHCVYPDNANPLLSYSLPAYDLQLAFFPTQFTQVNHEINQQMIARALSLLQLNKNDNVLDLFCGIGNFSLPIAKHCHNMTGVEGDDKAVKQAKANADKNQLSNCQFYCSDLFKDCTQEPWFKAYDKVLLDPARSGAADILGQINTLAPQRIVYVSCNPATFIRDAILLNQQGYILETFSVMDMFPQTQHIEVIASFTR